MENQPTIDRALYKKIKAMDRATMDNFVKTCIGRDIMMHRLKVLTMISSKPI